MNSCHPIRGFAFMRRTRRDIQPSRADALLCRRSCLQACPEAISITLRPTVPATSQPKQTSSPKLLPAQTNTNDPSARLHADAAWPTRPT